MFTNHVSDKRLSARIYGELLKFYNKQPYSRINRDFHVNPVVKTTLPTHGIQSLIQELRSHMPLDTAKKYFFKESKGLKHLFKTIMGTPLVV